MNLEQWNLKSKTEQDLLSAQFGLTRSGLNNELLSEEELLKIPEPKVIEIKIEPIVEVEKSKIIKKPIKLGAKKKK